MFMEQSLDNRKPSEKLKFPFVVSDEEIHRVLCTQPHQHVVELTEKGRSILNGYLKITGRETIDKMVERNKQQLNKIAGFKKGHQDG